MLSWSEGQSAHQTLEGSRKELKGDNDVLAAYSRFQAIEKVKGVRSILL